MVEHSVVVHEEVNEAADYLKALDCAKFDQGPLSDPDQKSGECAIELEGTGKLMLGYSKEDENLIEKSLL